jgi:4-hydroxythreonine-4-phosphate dehydrogenase
MPTNSDPTSSQRSTVASGSERSRSQANRDAIAIALGDPAGIGAEVTLKALARAGRVGEGAVLVGCRRWLEASFFELRRHSRELLADPAGYDCVDLPLPAPVRFGRSGAAEGEASFAWLSAAVDLVRSGRCRSLVTAPICKASWQAAGHPYPGQTERLAELAGIPAASMLFTARAPAGEWRLNTLLATTHVPLAQVPGLLGPELLHRQLDRLLAFCLRFRSHPHLVVAGLNPHAGEGGSLGREEREWLGASLDEWRDRHPEVRLEGPLPPDTCWLSAAEAWRSGGPGPDGYLALYHDQGLIPVKLLAFEAAVNTTLGLPYLRTSPDHGTAFDIAGRGLASPASMAAAIATARELG